MSLCKSYKKLCANEFYRGLKEVFMRYILLFNLFQLTYFYFWVFEYFSETEPEIDLTYQRISGPEYVERCAAKSLKYFLNKYGDPSGFFLSYEIRNSKPTKYQILSDCYTQ